MNSGYTVSLRNLQRNNDFHLNKLHPVHRLKFIKFLNAAAAAGTPIWIISGLRSEAEQKKLFDEQVARGIPAAKAGGSFHNYGLAIDVIVWNPITKTFSNQVSDLAKLEKLATAEYLNWLGRRPNGKLWLQERRHFEYNNYEIQDLISLKKRGRVNDEGFVYLSEVVKKSVTQYKKTNVIYDTTVGVSSVKTEETIIQTEEAKLKKFNIKTEVQKANGIWQIIKLVADQYSLSQTICDATIAHNQGSLFSFVQNVVQQPWLQFFGDTIDNQYYFFVRKEPFDYAGFSKLPYNSTIAVEDVLAEDLSWYDGPIFSWYQIIPRGSFIGEQNLIFAYVTSVFFEEYADIWGSKPNIQVSNYLSTGSSTSKSTYLAKAKDDLRYMVESNAYLPFTRNGSITIKGKTNVKRGYKIRYLPTKEVFYVTSVSQKISINENGTDFITVLKVERGMKIEYAISPDNATTNSYFNLILYNDSKTKSIKKEVTIPASTEKLYFYFDNNRTYDIDLNEKFQPTGEDKKMVDLIKKFPEMRSTLSQSNARVIRAITTMIAKNPLAERFICKGFVDSDNLFISKKLPMKRAETLKQLVITDYLSKYKALSEAQLKERIITDDDATGATYATKTLDKRFIITGESNIEDPMVKLSYSRFASFKMESYKRIEESSTTDSDISWKVNRKVFQFFLNRKQNG